eukprot:symbB.v1.2.025890.t2/scaffold2547.1/size76550/2
MAWGLGRFVSFRRNGRFHLQELSPAGGLGHFQIGQVRLVHHHQGISNASRNPPYQAQHLQAQIGRLSGGRSSCGSNLSGHRVSRTNCPPDTDPRSPLASFSKPVAPRVPASLCDNSFMLKKDGGALSSSTMAPDEVQSPEQIQASFRSDAPEATRGAERLLVPSEVVICPSEPTTLRLPEEVAPPEAVKMAQKQNHTKSPEPERKAVGDVPDAKTPEGVTTKHPPRRQVKGRRLSAKNEYTRLSIKDEMRKSILNDQRPVSMNEKGNLEPKPDEGRLISCKHKWADEILLSTNLGAMNCAPWHMSIEAMRQAWKVDATDPILTSVVLRASAKLSWERSLQLSQGMRKMILDRNETDSGLQNAVLTAYQEGNAWPQSLQLLKDLLVHQCEPEGLGVSAAFTACGISNWKAMMDIVGFLQNGGCNGSLNSESCGALVIAMRPWRWTLYCLKMIRDLKLFIPLLAMCAAAESCASSGIQHLPDLMDQSGMRVQKVLQAHSPAPRQPASCSHPAAGSRSRGLSHGQVCQVVGTCRSRASDHSTGVQGVSQLWKLFALGLEATGICNTVSLDELAGFELRVFCPTCKGYCPDHVRCRQRAEQAAFRRRVDGPTHYEIKGPRRRCLAPWIRRFVLPPGLKRESYKITGDPKKPDGAPNSYVKMTCARANFRAAGWKDEDFKKPMITIAAPHVNLAGKSGATLAFMARKSKEEAEWAQLKRGLGVDDDSSLEDVKDSVLIGFERWRRNAEGEHHGIRHRIKSMLFTRQSVQDRLTAAVRSGIPPNLRGTMWFLCSGGLSKRRSSDVPYTSLVEMGHRCKESTAGRTIANDLPRTGCDDSLLPALENVLLAYAVRNKEIGYCQSMNFIVATMLMYCSEEQSFWILCSLIEDLLPDAYYTESLSGLRADLHLFNWCVQQNCIDIAPILMNWFLCLFVNTLPAEHAHRVLDCVFHEGHKALFRTGLAILSLRSQELRQSNSVVEAYSFLRQPFGLDDRAPSDALQAAEISPKELLDAAFSNVRSTWLKGFRLETLEKERARCVAQVKADDAQVAARKQIWAEKNAAGKEDNAKENFNIHAQHQMDLNGMSET